MSGSISPGESVIDSRDVIARLIELRDDPSLDIEEYNALRELDMQGEQEFEDWEYGTLLVHEAYFTEYAEEYAYDLGVVDQNLDWPHCCIDWDAAASMLMEDYTEIQFGEETYYAR